MSAHEWAQAIGAIVAALVIYLGGYRAGLEDARRR
jgi:hypothetical protein